MLLRSDDGGASWQVVDDSVLSTDGSPTNGAQGFVFDTSTSPSTVYYYGFGLHKSTDGGATWTDLIAPQGPPDDPNHGLTETPVEAVALDPAQPGTIYAVTHYDAALLVRSSDGGATWEELPSGIAGQPLDMGMGIPGEPSIRLGIDPGDASRLYQSVLGDQSGVLAYSFAESTDQGQTWTVLDGAEADRARAVLEAGPGASADSIDALMALTGGALPSPPDWMPVGSHVIGAAADDPPALYAFGGSGVYKSTDAGATWNPANSGLGYAWVERVVVDPASPSTIYACTKQGIGKSIDGGATWDTVYEGSVGQLIVAPSYTSVLYAWTSVGLLRSDDGGATWDDARLRRPSRPRRQRGRWAAVDGRRRIQARVGGRGRPGYPVRL